MGCLCVNCAEEIASRKGGGDGGEGGAELVGRRLIPFYHARARSNPAAALAASFETLHRGLTNTVNGIDCTVSGTTAVSILIDAKALTWTCANVGDR